ncbi:LGFP repeat-containing protein [Streptomyces decoyicus]|uniref:LGFP repeat-containing protein n=1 Tax=Streptomyces decoyicus TaxID=249567 RepID=UPI0033A403B0
MSATLAALAVQITPAAADPDPGDICGQHLQGDILAKYQQIGGETSPLGCPTSDELTTPDNVGRYTTFTGGSIYWSPDTGAHPIWGDIKTKWADQGWEKGDLGYPKGDELTNPDGEGKRQEFQHGTIYWHPTKSNGAHAVSGSIGWVWGAFKYESGDFGYPTSDVTWDRENREYYQNFQGSKSIFHNQEGGAPEGCAKECVGYYGTAPDPEQAGNLINQTRVEFPMAGDMGSWKDTFIVRAWPTRAGRIAGRPLIPVEWDQMWDRVPEPWGMTEDKKDSLYKQFACHVMYVAPKPGGWLGGWSWDLESFRPNISWARAMNPLTNSKCNWE